MATKATVCKAQLQLCDFNRDYFGAHSLTIAQHPSETEERLLMRIVAFALHASEALSFTRGLSTEDEPDLWEKDLTGDILCWIDLGQPEEKRVRKACGRAHQAFIYTYQPRNAGPWWSKYGSEFQRFGNLSVGSLEVENGDIASLYERNMDLQCTIQDDGITLSDGAREVILRLHWLKQAPDHTS
ncbi:MAG: YaeQ family protein [Gammaproteobacteria bacterium]